MNATPASTDTNKVIIPNDFRFLSQPPVCPSGSRGSAGLGKAHACDGKRLDDYDKVCWQHDDEMDSAADVPCQECGHRYQVAELLTGLRQAGTGSAAGISDVALREALDLAVASLRRDIGELKQDVHAAAAANADAMRRLLTVVSTEVPDCLRAKGRSHAKHANHGRARPVLAAFGACRLDQDVLVGWLSCHAAPPPRVSFAAITSRRVHHKHHPERLQVPLAPNHYCPGVGK